MGDPIYASGEATITPPLTCKEDIEEGAWYTEGGERLLYTDYEGGARHYDSGLAEIVKKIADLGSKVNGTFEWAIHEDEFGKTVIADNKITEYAGYKAYGDGTTENENVHVIQVSSAVDPVKIAAGLQRIACTPEDARWVDFAVAILRGEANVIQ